MSTFSSIYNEMTHAQRADLAARVKTHPGYLWQIATGRRKAGADLIARLMKADNRITFDMMRNQAA